MDPVPTPQPNNNVQYEIDGYSVSINCDTTNMIISLYKDSELPRKKYEAKFEYDQLIKKSKWFRLFDTINSVANEISYLFIEKKFKLQEDYEKIDLYLLIQTRQVDDIRLEIPQTEVQDKNIIEDLCNSINQMKKTLANHTRLFEILNKSHQFKDMIKRAEILNNRHHKGLLEDEIKDLATERISSNQHVEYTLLYIASIDGDSSQSFHSYCDNKGPTLVVIKTTKDLIFGGYTSLAWDQCNNYKNDPKAFLFSVSNLKIYPVKLQANSMYCNSSYGPTYGSGHDLHVSNNFFSSQSCYVSFNGYSNGSGHELNNNERTFTVKELEVYQVTTSKKEKDK